MNSMSGSMGPTGSNARNNPRDKIPKGYRKGQIQQFTPEMMDLFQRYMGMAGPDSYLSKLAGGDEETFNQIERPALQQFTGLQGNLASRFSGMGLGARRSSGFQNTANAAAQDFASQLQSQRHGLQRQAIMDLSDISSNLLGQRPYEQFLTKKDRGTSTAETIGKLGGAIPGLISSFSGGGSAGDALKGASSIFGGG